MPRWLIVPCLAVMLLAGGCGTILNFKSGNPVIYGGVAKDVEFAATPWAPTPSSPVDVDRRSMLLLWVADFGLSAVADTVTMPVIVYRALFTDKTSSKDSLPPMAPPQSGAGAVSAAPANRSP
jgi:uncharacterized protein YceK